MLGGPDHAALAHAGNSQHAEQTGRCDFEDFGHNPNFKCQPAERRRIDGRRPRTVPTDQNAIPGCIVIYLGSEPAYHLRFEPLESVRPEPGRKTGNENLSIGPGYPNSLAKEYGRIALKGGKTVLDTEDNIE